MAKEVSSQNISNSVTSKDPIETNKASSYENKKTTPRNFYSKEFEDTGAHLCTSERVVCPQSGTISRFYPNIRSNGSMLHSNIKVYFGFLHPQEAVTASPQNPNQAAVIKATPRSSSSSSTLNGKNHEDIGGDFSLQIITVNFAKLSSLIQLRNQTFVGPAAAATTTTTTTTTTMMTTATTMTTITSVAPGLSNNAATATGLTSVLSGATSNPPGQKTRSKQASWPFFVRSEPKNGSRMSFPFLDLRATLAGGQRETKKKNQVTSYIYY